MTEGDGAIGRGGNCQRRCALFTGRLLRGGCCWWLPVAADFADEVGGVVFAEQVTGEGRIGAAGRAEEPLADAASGTGQTGSVLSHLGSIEGAQQIVAAGIRSQQRAVSAGAHASDALGDVGGIKGGDAVDPAGQAGGDGVRTGRLDREAVDAAAVSGGDRRARPTPRHWHRGHCARGGAVGDAAAQSPRHDCEEAVAGLHGRLPFVEEKVRPGQRGGVATGTNDVEDEVKQRATTRQGCRVEGCHL